MVEFIRNYIDSQSPSRSSIAILCGMLLGTNPNIFVLQNIFVVLGLFMFRLPKRITLLTLVLSFVAGFVVLDQLSHNLGYYLLHADSLQALFSAISSMPLLAFTGFSNTVTLGSTPHLNHYISYCPNNFKTP